MARTVAGLPKGSRITDHISLGMITKTFPREMIESILLQTGKASQRQRLLPAEVVTYYVIALALYMEVSYGEVLRCLLEGLRWLGVSTQTYPLAGKSGISQARSRLGTEPLRRLYEQAVVPIAETETQGVHYRGWRVVSVDGSTLDVADTPENETAFGRPGASRGHSAYPQIRFVSLLETGTRVLFGARMGAYREGETSLAREAMGALDEGMLCLADRSFFGFELWSQAAAQGAELVWRVKKNLRLPCSKRLADGSYLSKIYPSTKHRRHDRGGRVVRVIEYTLEGVVGAEPMYRLLTTILDEKAAPAAELAMLYQERWEIETALDELKTHLRGRQIVLRSRTPELVRQEFYGLLLAHFAVRKLMHEAASWGNVDSDRLSFVHAVRVIRRKLPQYAALPPSATRTISSGSAR
jgi:hypothetical protein